MKAAFAAAVEEELRSASPSRKEDDRRRDCHEAHASSERRCHALAGELAVPRARATKKSRGVALLSGRRHQCVRVRRLGPLAKAAARQAPKIRRLAMRAAREAGVRSITSTTTSVVALRLPCHRRRVFAARSKGVRRRRRTLRPTEADCASYSSRSTPPSTARPRSCCSGISAHVRSSLPASQPTSASYSR